MKQINVLVLGVLIATGLSSCIKDGDPYDPAAQYELEKPVIKQYAEEYLDNPQFQEETGIWFELVNTGDPSSYQYKVIPDQYNPSNSIIEPPVITVKYTGKLVEGNTVFDSNEEFEISLGRVIAAWQFAFLPKEILYDEDGGMLAEPVKFSGIGGLTTSGLGVGSIIRIVTPSLLAYRNQGQGKVPANAPLYFEIEVLDITPPSENGN